MSELKELIEQYLGNAKSMQLATVADSMPWICSVWFVADESMNIYWLSSTGRRHSKEIEQNPHVAGAMCLPQTPLDAVRGLQFEGVATILTDPAEIQRALDLHVSHGTFSAERIEQLAQHPDNPHKFYRAQPKLFVLFDAEHFPGDPRQEYSPIATK